MIGSALKTQRTAICFVALTALAMAVSLASQVSAQDSWSVRLSEKEGELAHTGDAMWTKWLMWDIGYQRMVDRNSPYLEVNNASTSVDPITQFHITIGDNRFNFAPINGVLATLGSTTPGFTLTSSTVGNLGDELVVNIGGGGLAPGQSVRFKVKLGIDPSFAAAYAASFGTSLPDYRTVLFDMNGINVYDGGTISNSSADNSKAFVVFDTNIQSNTSTFPDAVVPVGQFFNSNIRAYSELDPVNLFELQGQAIPEPTSIGLVMLGITGFFLSARWRSRPSVA
jgi:hypothetical protein